MSWLKKDFIVEYNKGEKMLKGIIFSFTLLMISSCSLLQGKKEATAYKDLPNHNHISCNGVCDVKLK